MHPLNPPDRHLYEPDPSRRPSSTQDRTPVSAVAHMKISLRAVAALAVIFGTSALTACGADTATATSSTLAPLPSEGTVQVG
ncbi:MAG: hypothetical protein RL238_2584 [Actinomycetota bacterium]